MKLTTLLLLTPFLSALAAPAGSIGNVAVARQSQDDILNYRRGAHDDVKASKRQSPDDISNNYRRQSPDDISNNYRRQSPDEISNNYRRQSPDEISNNYRRDTVARQSQDDILNYRRDAQDDAKAAKRQSPDDISNNYRRQSQDDILNY